MKFRFLLLILFVSRLCYSQSEKLNDYKVTSIKKIITLFKQNNIDNISNMVNFPLQREYPIPSIKDGKEFKKRFDEVFDKDLIDKIANSKTGQWSEVGWGGIMLDDGIVWIDSDEGKITAVNHQSVFEEKLKKELIDKEKESLHISLKTFESPTYKIKTKKFLIRIDELSNGKYRYASWKISEKELSKPNLILNNGILAFEGSGGNHVITFSNGKYTYKVYRNSIGEENSPDITLTVEKDGQTILTQDGTLIRK